MTQLDEAGRQLRAAQSVLVLTGAGISTDSGIPDFRGPQGVWTKNPAAQAMFTIDRYVADPDVRRTSWLNRRDHPAWTAEPNPAHHALVAWERTGRLKAIATQNIDGLHQRAGSDPRRVLELHGTLWRAVCLSCGGVQPMASVIARVDAGEEDPPCLGCGGILKSATVSFGQSLDPLVLTAATDAARACDLVVAIGTSLQVYPAAGLCSVAVESGAHLVIVNAQPTGYDQLAAAVVREPIGAAVPALTGALEEVR